MTKRRPQKAKPRRKALRNAPAPISDATYDSVTGRGEDQERFRIYRLCLCPNCGGSGKVVRPEGGNEGTTRYYAKCPDCRGEGKVLQCLATAPDEASVGTCLVQLGQEGEFEGCPMGLLDGKKWLIKPWLPSARNVSDAARTLAKSKGSK